jgi:hypothetical protein
MDGARGLVIAAGGFGLLIAGPATTRLASLSTLVHVGPGEGATAAGFVIGGTTEKLLLVRGVGPSLDQFGLTDGLPDPVLRVLNSSGREISRNNGWLRAPDVTEIRRVTAVVGAVPLGADRADAALLVHLAPGVYTVAFDSASGRAGAVLAEVYETDCPGALANLATLTALSAARPASFGTFHVTGLTPQKFLVRAVGPALAALGVGNALPDPKLTLFNYAGTGAAALNDDWWAPISSEDDQTEISAAATACGAFPLPADGKDAVVLVTLNPGAYTAQITGKGTDTGLVLLEVYLVP